MRRVGHCLSISILEWITVIDMVIQVPPNGALPWWMTRGPNKGSLLQFTLLLLSWTALFGLLETIKHLTLGQAAFWVLWMCEECCPYVFCDTLLSCFLHLFFILSIESKSYSLLPRIETWTIRANITPAFWLNRSHAHYRVTIMVSTFY